MVEKMLGFLATLSMLALIGIFKLLSRARQQRNDKGKYIERDGYVARVVPASSKGLICGALPGFQSRVVYFKDADPITLFGSRPKVYPDEHIQVLRDEQGRRDVRKVVE